MKHEAPEDGAYVKCDVEEYDDVHRFPRVDDDAGEVMIKRDLNSFEHDAVRSQLVVSVKRIEVGTGKDRVWVLLLLHLSFLSFLFVARHSSVICFVILLVMLILGAFITSFVLSFIASFIISIV